MKEGDDEARAPRRRRKKKRRAGAPRSGVQPRPHAAWIALAAACLLALLAGGSLLWDVVSPAPADNAGVRVGGVVGTITRTVVLAALAVYLYRKSEAYRDPAQFAPAALSRGHLGVIAAETRDHPIADGASTATTYRDLTDEQLVSVYEAIDRERAPGRFDELVLEVRRRTRTRG